MLSFVLEELAPSVFSRKKDALGTFTAYYFKVHPTYTQEQVRSLYYGSTALNPNERQKGLFALCGSTSWKSGDLKNAAAQSLSLLAKLCDPTANSHSQLFVQILIGADMANIRMLQLARHLNSSRGAPHAATFILSLFKNFNMRTYNSIQTEISSSLSEAHRDVLTKMQSDKLAKRVSTIYTSDKDAIAKHLAANLNPGLSLSLPAPAVVSAASVTSTFAGTAPPEGPIRNNGQPALSAQREAEKHTISARLMAFFSSRPTQEQLEAKGLIRPRSFGMGIEEIYRRPAMLASYDSAMHGQIQVPLVLFTLCQHMIRTNLIELQGIFRLSGDSVEIATVRERLDSGVEVDLTKVGSHSVAGLVKLFMRLLPQPLLLFSNYDPLIDAYRAEQFNDVSQRVGTETGNLPSSHRQTMIFLLDFLARVTALQSVNLMTELNLSVCFAPNILRPQKEVLERIAKDTQIAIGVVKQLLMEHVRRMVAREKLVFKEAPAEPAPAVKPALTADLITGVISSSTAPTAPPLTATSHFFSTAAAAPAKAATAKPAASSTPSTASSQPAATNPPVTVVASDDDDDRIPAHFERYLDEATQKYYYFNTLTQKVTWKKPSMQADALNAADAKQLFPPTPPAEQHARKTSEVPALREPAKASTGDSLPAAPKQPRRVSRMLQPNPSGGAGLLPGFPPSATTASSNPRTSSTAQSHQPAASDSDDESRAAKPAAATTAALVQPKAATPAPEVVEEDAEWDGERRAQLARESRVFLLHVAHVPLSNHVFFFQNSRILLQARVTSTTKSLVSRHGTIHSKPLCRKRPLKPLRLKRLKRLLTLREPRRKLLQPLQPLPLLRPRLLHLLPLHLLPLLLPLLPLPQRRLLLSPLPLLPTLLPSMVAGTLSPFVVLGRRRLLPAAIRIIPPGLVIRSSTWASIMRRRMKVVKLRWSFSCNGTNSGESQRMIQQPATRTSLVSTCWRTMVPAIRSCSCTLMRLWHAVTSKPSPVSW
jgi:hypothetical protein